LTASGNIHDRDAVVTEVPGSRVVVDDDDDDGESISVASIIEVTLLTP